MTTIVYHRGQLFSDVRLTTDGCLNIPSDILQEALQYKEDASYIFCKGIQQSGWHHEDGSLQVTHQGKIVDVQQYNIHDHRGNPVKYIAFSGQINTAFSLIGYLDVYQDKPFDVGYALSFAYAYTKAFYETHIKDVDMSNPDVACMFVSDAGAMLYHYHPVRKELNYIWCPKTHKDYLTMGSGTWWTLSEEDRYEHIDLCQHRDLLFFDSSRCSIQQYYEQASLHDPATSAWYIRTDVKTGEISHY